MTFLGFHSGTHKGIQAGWTEDRQLSGLICGLLLAVLMTAAMPGGADESYRVLEWQDLVPPNWEAPIILPAPEEDGHYPVIPESLVQGLDNQKVTLPGYMLPVEYERNMVSGFLLVPYLAMHTRGHVHHDANQMVYVRLDSPFEVRNLAAPYLVSGYIHVKSVTTEDGRTGYTIDRAQTRAMQRD